MAKPANALASKAGELGSYGFDSRLNYMTNSIKPIAPITRLRNQIMLNLIANNGVTTRPEIRVVNVKRDAKGVYHHRLTTVDVEVPTLAGNVSHDSVMRTADKWGQDIF